MFEPPVTAIVPDQRLNVEGLEIGRTAAGPGSSRVKRSQ